MTIKGSLSGKVHTLYTTRIDCCSGGVAKESLRLVNKDRNILNHKRSGSNLNLVRIERHTHHEGFIDTEILGAVGSDTVFGM